MPPQSSPDDHSSVAVATSSQHLAAEMHRRLHGMAASSPVVPPTAAAINTLLAKSPNTVVILDATQAESPWLPVLQEIVSVHPRARVVVLGRRADLQAVARAILAGARHFLVIDVPREVFATDIAALASGQEPNDDCMFGRVRAALPIARSGESCFRNGSGRLLSYEQAVQKCVEFGLSPQEIADHLTVGATDVQVLMRQRRSAPRMHLSLKQLGTAAAAVVVLVCGYAFATRMFSQDVRRYRLTGSVTFEGRPVPRGSISFACKQGGRQFSGYAGIADGKFDTLVDGKGHVGGKHILTVVGFDRVGAAANEEEDRPTPLFEPIEWEESFRYGPTTLTIGLPRDVGP